MNFLTYINDQSLVLSDLIQNLLNLSRIESGLGLTFKIAKGRGDLLIKQAMCCTEMMIIQIKSVSHEKICPDFSVLLFTYSPLDNSQLSD